MDVKEPFDETYGIDSNKTGKNFLELHFNCIHVEKNTKLLKYRQRVRGARAGVLEGSSQSLMKPV